MMWPWKVEKKLETPSDKKLEEIRNILFPPHEIREMENGAYYIDHSIDSNLDAALTELQEGFNDEVTRDTINKCIKKIIDVRHLLGVNDSLDKDAKYAIVDMERETTVIEAMDEIDDEF